MMLKPAQRYVCSHPGCTSSMQYAAGVFTRAVAVDHVRHAGWTVEPGESVCPKHAALEAVGYAEQATTRLPSLESQLRASVRLASSKRALRGDAERDLHANYGSRKMGYGR